MKASTFLAAIVAFVVQPLYSETAEELLTAGIDCAYGRNGRAKNETEALEYYKKASGKGSAEAAYRAARMYFYGIGTEEDKAMSRAYYTIAAEGGHAKASQELKKNFKVKAVSTPAAGVDLAPDSVKGKVLVLDYRNATIREYSHSTKSYGAEKAWEWDQLVVWEFDKSAQPTFEGGSSISYTKTGKDSASVTVEGWEYVSEYTLHFDTPTSGTVEEKTDAEADRWSAKGISFTLEPAP